MKFSALYRPVTFFSLKDSEATNSAAKSLLIPSPYAIKMAIINQAITLDGVDFGGDENKNFLYLREASIRYRIEGGFCVNNCFVKILKPSRSNVGVAPTVALREYVQLTGDLEIIFDVSDKQTKTFFKKYLPKINYFGKRGCFFQFIKFNKSPSTPNVKEFSGDNSFSGIIEQLDDFEKSSQFAHVNNYDSKRGKRAKKVYVIPVEKGDSSKSYTKYKVK